MMNSVDPNKRQRMTPAPGLPGFVLASPAPAETPAPGLRPSISGAPAASGDILDLLKGRGGKIKELEQEVATYKSLNQKLQEQLAEKNQHMQRLEAENVVLSQKVEHSAHSSTGGTSLSRLVEGEISKSVQLERELSALKEKEMRAQATARDLQNELALLKTEFTRKESSMKLDIEAARLHAQNTVDEAAQKVKQAELQLALAERRRVSEQEVSKAIEAQLQENKARVKSLQQQLLESQTRQHGLEAEVSRLQSSGPAVQLQLLQEQLKAKEAQLAALAGSRAAADAQAAIAASHTAATEAAASAAEAAVAAAQAQADAASAGASDLAALQALWAAVSRAVPGVTLAEAPATLTASLRELDEARRALGTKDEALMAAQVLAAATEGAVSDLRSQVASVTARMEAALTAEQVASRKLAVALEERDSLKRALTAAVSAEGLAAGTISGQIQAATAAARLGEAEKLAVELQARLDTASAEASALSAALSAAEQAARAATTRAEAAEARVKALSKEADALAGEVASLQEKLGRGDIVAGPAGSGAPLRVLHLKHNPEAQYKQGQTEAKLAQLTAENAALKEQIAALGNSGAGGGEGGGSGGSGASATLSVELAAKEAEAVVLRHRLNEAEKTGARLKAVFKERIAVFREACLQLFGYRVDMTSEAAKDVANAPTTFSLKPLHADDPAALLVFRYTKDSGMELIPNAYTTSKLAREVDTFVRKFGSISAFTANLTMDNFQKQTQA